MDAVKDFWPLLLLGGWLAYRTWKTKRVVMKLEDLKQQGATLVDVRSKAEFSSGSAPGSLNIPLDELNQRLSEIPADKPVVLACASGARSGMAASFLKSQGYAEVYNIGSWTHFMS